MKAGQCVLSSWGAAERDSRIVALTRAGRSAAYIARRLDLSQRHVVRLRARLRAEGRLP